MRVVLRWAGPALAALTVACGAGEGPGEPSSPADAPPATRADGSPTASSTVDMAREPAALREVARGFRQPTFATHAGDGSGRLFVLEKQGIVRVVVSGQVGAEPFLDIRSLVESDNSEQGLLGMAVHPSFASNGRAFVTYTSRQRTVVLAEVRARDPRRGPADPASLEVLLSISHPRPNHNGGMIAFGPDGYLYFGTGDGGGGGDPDRAAQDLGSVAGKILRLDVGGAGGGYRIPPDNPFVGRAGARAEIWALGFRNPWRFSFDRATGDLWIGDVGQSAVEEVNRQPGCRRAGENYGWSILEGDRCFRPPTNCATAGMAAPVAWYTHADGCSVTGGYVYRGSRIASLQGTYVFADYCKGEIRAIAPGGGPQRASRLIAAPTGIASFGEDEAGELYIVVHESGRLMRLE